LGRQTGVLEHCEFLKMLLEKIRAQLIALLPWGVISRLVEERLQSIKTTLWCGD